MNKRQALISEIAAIADRVVGDEYDEGVRSAVLHSLALVNKHLPDNEVSVPVDRYNSLKEAAGFYNQVITATDEDRQAVGSDHINMLVDAVKAVLQADKGVEHTEEKVLNAFGDWMCRQHIKEIRTEQGITPDPTEKYVEEKAIRTICRFIDDYKAMLQADKGEGD